MQDKDDAPSPAGRGSIEHHFNIAYLYPPAIGLAGILSMLYISALMRGRRLPVLPLSPFPEISFTGTRQLYILPVSFLVLGLIFIYDRRNYSLFFRMGDLGARVGPLKLLGLKGTESWKKIGPLIAGLLTGGTLIFMAAEVIGLKGISHATVIKLLPFVLIFSAANAWSEEIFGRFAVVAGLSGRLKPRTIFWISAGIFGIPHYFGTPGGPIGVLMAGFLGWLLAKAVYETRGMFWAWFIHFVQDVVIFTAQVMILAGAADVV